MTSNLTRDEIILIDATGKRTPLEVVSYPAGEPLINYDGGHIRQMVLRPLNMETFLAAMFFIDAYKERRGHTPSLTLPAVPGSRQDRLNPAGDCLFTLKSVANMINERGFLNVIVVDPHSDVTPALINNCRVVTAAQCLNAGWANRWDGIVAPDAGAAKRASLVGTRMGLQVSQGFKHRDVETGQLSGFDILLHPSVSAKGTRLLIVDDICDGGGTFIGLADVIRDRYPDITLDLYVTHGYFTKGYDDLLDRFERIYTTDTVIRDHDSEPDADRFIVTPVCGDSL